MRAVSFLCAIILFVSGCSKKIDIKEPAVVDDHSELVSQLQAKLYDIPMPFATGPAQLLSDPGAAPDTIILSYPTNISTQELIALYQQDMERFGWQEINNFGSEKETLLSFRKPQRWATISIRNHSNANELVLFTGFKA